MGLMLAAVLVAVAILSIVAAFLTKVPAIVTIALIAIALILFDMGVYPPSDLVPNAVILASICGILILLTSEGNPYLVVLSLFVVVLVIFGFPYLAQAVLGPAFTPDFSWWSDMLPFLS